MPIEEVQNNTYGHEKRGMGACPQRNFAFSGVIVNLRVFIALVWCLPPEKKCEMAEVKF